ncbi:MAG: hypothetical protein ACRCX2_14070 [Paraclostridium sp.]
MDIYFSRDMFRKYVNTIRENCKKNNFSLRVYYKRRGGIRARYYVTTEIDYMYDYDALSGININADLCFWDSKKVKVK